MIRAALAFVLLPSLCCAGEKKQPDLSAAIHVIGRQPNAHACIVGPHEVLTAGHVIDIRPYDLTYPLLSLLWSDDYGNGGELIPQSAFKTADLGVMCSEQELPHPATMARQPPAIGDDLWIVGYDWRSKKKAYAPRVWTFKVARIVANHIIYDDAGEPGMSGSCVFNAAGEVVGIHVWGVPVNDGHDAVGVAVGTWNLGPQVCK